MKKNIVKLIVFYILGLLIYSLVFYLTQSVILNALELTREEVEIFLDNPAINIILYTALYCFVTYMLYLYDRTSVEELNTALKEMKERVKMNEEQIRNNRYDNNYSSSSDMGNI